MLRAGALKTPTGRKRVLMKRRKRRMGIERRDPRLAREPEGSGKDTRAGGHDHGPKQDSPAPPRRQGIPRAWLPERDLRRVLNPEHRRIWREYCHAFDQ